MAALLTQRVGDWVAAHAAQFIYAYWAHSPYWSYPLPPWRCVSSAGARAPHPTIYFYIFCNYIFCNHKKCNYTQDPIYAYWLKTEYFAIP